MTVARPTSGKSASARHVTNRAILTSQDPIGSCDVRIALFVTCLADALFPDVGRATVMLPERLGHQVVLPEKQTCCGQMHINTGYPRQALKLVRHHVGVFEAYDAVVAP